MISVQQQDFNVDKEYQALNQYGQSGAIVTFIGRVRDFAEAGRLSQNALTNDKGNTFLLEHYPGMTEAVLEKIEAQACQRWQLLRSRVIHRVGKLSVDDQIVFVGVSSAHRADAFDACRFIIDRLKTEAPFWKKEGEQWVDAKEVDQQAADKWISG